ncbi:MAG TPA: class III signal peptide-containing protein, partial [Allocoleopsis sp.]
MKYNYKSSNRIFNSNVSKNNKAQVSVEYLIIIGVSLAVLIPGTYFFYEYSKSSNEGAIRSQINQIGSSIISNAESVYGLGEGSLVTTEVRYPKNIRDVYILDDSELVIKYELSSGMNE